MPPRIPLPTNKSAAEKLFNRKASPDADLSPKEFLKKQGQGISKSMTSAKDKVIDKVSDVLSYPARRAAQKSMLKSDEEFKEVKQANQNKQSMQRSALKAVIKKPQLSQRDQYARSMNTAVRNGGSSGVGVGA